MSVMRSCVLRHLQRHREGGLKGVNSNKEFTAYVDLYPGFGTAIPTALYFFILFQILHAPCQS